MLAGLFANKGLYIGGKALSPTVSNPKGYFETKGMNDLNNFIISEFLKWPSLNRLRKHIAPNIDWDVRAYPFASPRKYTVPEIPQKLQNAIKYYSSKENFCYKDPRFCVTLPVWLRYLGRSVKYLVVFREPGKTIASYMRNGAEIYKPPLKFKPPQLEAAYSRNYERLIEWSGPDWMFIHYDQILSGSVSDALERFTGMGLDWSHVSKSLQRTKSSDFVVRDRAAERTYRRLCDRAAHP